MINQKPNSLFRHFGEELTVTIGATPKTVTGMFLHATTVSSDNRAGVIDGYPTAIFQAPDVAGIGIGETVQRGSKTYYVIGWFGDDVLLTLNLSEDLP